MAIMMVATDENDHHHHTVMMIFDDECKHGGQKMQPTACNVPREKPLGRERGRQGIPKCRKIKSWPLIFKFTEGESA